MDKILLFILGMISVKYIVPILDVLIEEFGNKKILKAIKIKSEIRDIENSMDVEDMKTQKKVALIKDSAERELNLNSAFEGNVIGFGRNIEEEYEDYEYEE